MQSGTGSRSSTIPSGVPDRWRRPRRPRPGGVAEGRGGREVRGAGAAEAGRDLLQGPDPIHPDHEWRQELEGAEDHLRSRAERADHQQHRRRPAERDLDRLLHSLLLDGTARIELLRSFDKGGSFERRPIVVDETVGPGTITPNAQEPVRDAAGPVRRRGRPEKRGALCGLAGWPVPRRGGGCLLHVDRWRQDLVEDDPDRQDAGQLPTSCVSRRSCRRSRSARTGSSW